MGEISAHGQTQEIPTRSPALIWWLIGVWLASALYLVPFVDRAWVPHDEGLLGQSAERVLGGQLPHRDFDEVYTGGLSYLHALAFKLGGVKSIALRWTAFVFVLAWVPAVFWIASRSARAPAAALVTAAAVTWSVPNYFSGMPSWYNLFFATFGIAALMRHLETGRARWLVAAGLAGGCSFLVKSAGLYYIAGAVLFLVAYEVELSRPAVPLPGRRPDASDRRRTGWLDRRKGCARRRPGRIGGVAGSNAFEPRRPAAFRRAGCGGMRLPGLERNRLGPPSARSAAGSSLPAGPSISRRRRDPDRRIPDSVCSNGRTRRLLPRRVHRAATASVGRQRRAAAVADGAAAGALRPHPGGGRAGQANPLWSGGDRGVRGVAGLSPRVFPASRSVPDALESGPAPEHGRRGRGRSAAGPRRDIDGARTLAASCCWWSRSPRSAA